MILIYKMIGQAQKDGLDSVAETILKKSFEMKHSIKNCSMHQFLEQANISKSTFQRYLKSIEIQTYTQFKSVFFQEISYIRQDLERRKKPKEKSVRPEIGKIRTSVHNCSRLFFFISPEAQSIVTYYLPYFLYFQPNIIWWPYVDSTAHFLKDYNLNDQDLFLCAALNYTPEQLKLAEDNYLQKNKILPVHTGESIFIGQKGMKKSSEQVHYFFISPHAAPAKRIYEFCEHIESILFDEKAV
jgi:hypothetical protein